MNGGWETFLSYEDSEKDILVGLPRLRKAGLVAYWKGIKGWKSLIIRELHVDGTAVVVSAHGTVRFQHQEFGICLMEEVENIAKEEHCTDQLLVILGVSTRHYYHNKI